MVCAQLGIALALAAWVLLLFASVSPPAWESVYFLRATVGGTETVFGMLGECVKGGACTAKNVGYDLMVNGADVSVNSPKVLHNLTYVLILHPIAGFFCFIGMIFGLIGFAAGSRALTILMALSNFIGGIIALVVFVIDMVLWNILRNRIRNAGYDAMLGNANWLTVGAVVAAFLASFTACCGAFGRFATGRSAGEKY